MANSNLNRAKKAKNDEFYTQYETIEDELKHYKKHFEGKTVYCNCDDPRWSNFFKYFVDNFHELKLKRLMASCYVDQSYNLFTINDKREPAVWADYDGWLVDGRTPEVSEIEVKELKGDGDFRSEECVELLKQSDIVVTNPPFSLLKEYIPFLIEYNKDFLVLGTTTIIPRRKIFLLIENGRVWPGTKFNKRIEFEVPSDTVIKTRSGRLAEDGRKLLAVGNITWWTNLEYERSYKDIELTSTYKDNEDKYPKYDNYDAINVDKIADIPKDYKFPIGVPITFIGKWNPEQFEIIGMFSTSAFVSGVEKYARIFIRNKRLNPEIYGGEQS